MSDQSRNPQPDDIGIKARRNKRPKPYLIEWRLLNWPTKGNTWSLYGRYRTADERDATLENAKRKHNFNIAEFRTVDPLPKKEPEMFVRKLSDGSESTLGNYLKLSKFFFGDESKAVKFLEQKIKESPAGENEQVISDETQMVAMLMGLNQDDRNLSK
jgi:hypothetical protein